MKVHVKMNINTDTDLNVTTSIRINITKNTKMDNTVNVEEHEPGHLESFVIPLGANREELLEVAVGATIPQSRSLEKKQN